MGSHRAGRIHPSIWMGLAAGLGTGFAPAVAQQPGPLLLEAPASTEVMAYGDAPWLFSSEPALLFYAPALLERADGVSAGYQRYGSEGTLVSLSGAGDGLGGGFAVGLRYLSYRTDPGLPDAQDLQSLALTPGAIGVRELAATVGYARTLFGIQAGAAISLVEGTRNQSTDRGLAFDFGLATDVGPLMVALTARGVGPDLELVNDPCAECTTPTILGEYELPSRLALGVSTDDFEVGPFDLFLTSQLGRRRDGEVIPAGGFELSYWPVQGYTFRLRAGLQRVVEDERSPFTVGAAFTADQITIEYAFQGFDSDGDGHRFGFRWR